MVYTMDRLDHLQGVIVSGNVDINAMLRKDRIQVADQLTIVQLPIHAKTYDTARPAVYSAAK